MSHPSFRQCSLEHDWEAGLGPEGLGSLDSGSSLVWLAVNEDGVSLLDQHSMQLLARYSYDNVVTFGGCQDDFMLVVTSDTDGPLPPPTSTKHRYNHSDRASSEDSSGTTKLLFNAGKPQVRFRT